MEGSQKSPSVINHLRIYIENQIFREKLSYASLSVHVRSKPL